MPTTSLNNSNDSNQRRKELQRRRNLKFVIACGRSLVLGSMCYGLFWLISLPNWVITNDSQVEVDGSNWLFPKTIKSISGLSYPQSLWDLPTQQLKKKLEVSPPIRDAAIHRRLLPPGLIIQIEERQPVAQVFSPSSSHTKTLAPRPLIGFLDAEGTFLPIKYYTPLKKDLPLPSLKFIGLNDNNKAYWPELYRLVSQSQINIYEIDWQNPNNLILKTKLGMVYLGGNPNNLSKQMEVLQSMAKLNTEIDPAQIVYIDLINPNAPFINLIKKPNSFSQ